MANQKTYTAKEAALAVLAKAQELLGKSSIVKSEAPAKIAEAQSGMHSVEYYSNQPFEKSESDNGFEPFQKADMLHDNVAQRRMARAKSYKDHGDHNNHKIAIEGAKESHKEQLGAIKDQPKPNLPKSENPDEKQDAKLGEEVEGLCERHMIENKSAERKEGHRIVKSELCKMCKGGKDMQKSEFAELYEDLAKMEKEEKPGENEIGTKFVKAENKEAPSNPMKPKVKEEQAPQRDAKNFETEPGKSSQPADARQAETAAPQANPVEQKEGNNPPAGSTPADKQATGATPGTGKKGVHKLSFFMGHAHHKKNMKKGLAIG